MTKKEAREELAGQYIGHLLDYGERALPEESVKLKLMAEALDTLGIFKVYGGLRDMLTEKIKEAESLEAIL
jgi:hypothetical protein